MRILKQGIPQQPRMGKEEMTSGQKSEDWESKGFVMNSRVKRFSFLFYQAVVVFE